MLGRLAKKILFFAAAVALFSCSHAKPHGKVIHLDNFEEQKAAPPAPAVVDASVHTQSEHEGLPVPSAKDDAAVFYFSQGQAYSLDNDVPRAVEAYRATLAYDPNSALVHARLAAELVKTGAYQEARELCEKAIKLDPKYVDSYLLLAGIQVSTKEYDGALTTYRKALAQDPENRDALLYYGVTLAEEGKTKEGIAQLEKLVKLKDKVDSNIDRSVAYYYLAKLQEQGNPQAALKSLEMAMKTRPGFAKAALMAADIYMEKSEARKAKEVLEEAFHENHQADLAERLAEIYMSENDYKGAVVYMETLVEEDPANENMRLKLALLYWTVGLLDKAHVVMSDLHNRYPSSSEISFYMGELEVLRGHQEDALIYYKMVSSDYAKYEQAVARAAQVYRDGKRFPDGEAFLRDALKRKPDAIAFYPVLAAFLEDQSKLKEAREVLEEGKKLFPNDESILYYLGFLYDKMGDKEQGLKTMQKLLTVNPNNANALNFVGYTLLERGENLDEAGRHLKRAHELKPNDAFILDSYGWLLHKQGKARSAMVYLEKAHSLKPEEPVIAEHLADAYVAMGLKEKALVVYQAIMKSGLLNEDKARVELKVQNLRSALVGRTDSDGEAKTARKPASR